MDSCTSGSSLSDADECFCPPASVNDSESDDEIVTDSTAKRDGKEAASSSQECNTQWSSDDVAALNSQLQVEFDALKLEMARLNSDLQVKERELKAYKLKLDLTAERICSEKQNASRGSTVKPPFERSSFARRLSGFFALTPTGRSFDASKTDEAASLENEARKIQIQTCIWYAMIEFEAARNVETKKQLDMASKSYDSLLMQYQQVATQLDVCRKELNECRQNAFSVCAELREKRQRLTSSYDEKVRFEHSEAEKLRAELRLETDIKRYLIEAVGEKDYQTICKRAKLKQSSVIKPHFSSID